MGRLVLLTVALLGCAACAIPDDRPLGQDSVHATLACQACHQGGLVDRELATVPSETCSASNCHATDNPAIVSMGTVEFSHRGHASTGDLAIGCAGCHTHTRGEDPLVTEDRSCILCHRAELSGGSGQACRLCHVGDPEGLTSQGVPVPHSNLPWIDGGCVRCHYDVAGPEGTVSMTRCAGCHVDAGAVVRQALGSDLHPSHTEMTCSSCHEDGEHQILAMSSTVFLRCADCHPLPHDLALEAEPLAVAVCNDCHGAEHSAEQRLILGLLPGNGTAMPSEKFMAGLTCRSCHRENARQPEGVRNAANACVGCHREEYALVLDWWRDGLVERTARTEAYLGTASAQLAAGTPSDSTAGLLGDAYELLDLLRDAGGVHNLPLAHRMLEGVIRKSEAAYRAAGRIPPMAPKLGTAPSMGLCNYCHYDEVEVFFTAGMDSILHRDVMGLGR